MIPFDDMIGIAHKEPKLWDRNQVLTVPDILADWQTGRLANWHWQADTVFVSELVMYLCSLLDPCHSVPRYLQRGTNVDSL